MGDIVPSHGWWILLFPINPFFYLNLISEVSSVVSHSFRLFGNIFGGFMILVIVSSLVKQFFNSCRFIGIFRFIRRDCASICIYNVGDYIYWAEELGSINMDSMIFVVLGAGLAIGLGAIGSAIGEGYIAMNAMNALGRQPAASQKIFV